MSNKFTAKQKRKILERNKKKKGGKCNHCKKPMSFPGDKKYDYRNSNAAQVDHIVPQKLNGKNKYWNAQVLDRECNRKKGAECGRYAKVKHDVRNNVEEGCNIL